MSENFAALVKELTSTSNSMKSIQITDPKKFVTDKQTINEIKLEDQLKFGTRRSLAICQGNAVVSKITLHLEIFSDDNITKSDIMQFNPILTLELCNGPMLMIKYCNSSMLLNNYINPELYILTKIENNKYVFTIDLNIEKLLSCVIVSQYSALRLNIEACNDSFNNKITIGNLSAFVTYEKYDDSFIFADNEILHFAIKIINFQDEPVYNETIGRYSIWFNGVMDVIYFTIVSKNNQLIDDDIIKNMSLYINGIELICDKPMNEILEQCKNECNNMNINKNTGIIDLRNIHDMLNKFHKCEKGDLENKINFRACDKFSVKFNSNDQIKKYNLNDLNVLFFGYAECCLRFNDRPNNAYCYDFCC